MRNTLFFTILMSLVLSACETIEDRNEMGHLITKEQIKINVTQNPSGSNTIIVENLTDEILPYWDWGTGWSNKQKDTIYIPFGGDYTLNFTAFSQGGSVTVSQKFSIAENDEEFFTTDPAWLGLTGNGEGKTWVWATDHPSGYLAGNGPEDSVTPAWWTMKPSDYWGTTTDEVYMDLDGAANFKHTKGDGSVVTGVFNVIEPFVINGQTFSGFEVLGGPTFPWPASGKYHITHMNEDELSIHAYAAYDVALYKRKGFNY
jgi:hypothetical protein